MKTNIPEKFQLKLPIHHNTFLIDGKIGNWNGEFTEVVSTLFSNSENDKYTILGDSPKMDEKHALLALDAADKAYANGTGEWPTMKVYERINCMQKFVDLMILQRDEVVKLVRFDQDSGAALFERTPPVGVRGDVAGSEHRFGAILKDHALDRMRKLEPLDVYLRKNKEKARKLAKNRGV